MFRSKLIVPALSAVCLLASQAVVPTLAVASPLHASNPGVMPVVNPKTVKLNLTNNTATALDLKVGDQPLTVEAGKTVKVQAPAGSRITIATATGTRAAGEVVAEISKELSGATIRIN